MSKQQFLLDKLGGHVMRMIELGHWKGIAFVEHSSYDETQLRVRAYHLGDSRAQDQVARLFVVEQDFSLLVRIPDISAHDQSSDDTSQGQASKSVAFHIHCCPQIRAADSANGECSAQVLRSVLQPPSNLTSHFQQCIRVTETDECPSNPRAEALLLRDRYSGHKPWKQLFFPCLAHKVHAIATRNMGLTRLDCRGRHQRLQTSVFRRLNASISSRCRTCIDSTAASGASTQPCIGHAC